MSKLKVFLTGFIILIGATGLCASIGGVRFLDIKPVAGIFMELIGVVIMVASAAVFVTMKVSFLEFVRGWFFSLCVLLAGASASAFAEFMGWIHDSSLEIPSWGFLLISIAAAALTAVATYQVFKSPAQDEPTKSAN